MRARRDPDPHPPVEPYLLPRLHDLFDEGRVILVAARVRIYRGREG